MRGMTPPPPPPALHSILFFSKNSAKRGFGTHTQGARVRDAESRLIAVRAVLDHPQRWSDASQSASQSASRCARIPSPIEGSNGA